MSRIAHCLGLLAGLGAACSDTSTPPDKGNPTPDVRGDVLARDARPADLAQKDAGPLTKVDIIWVVMESIYLSAQRQAIKAAAVDIFGHAALKRLDVRMGVTGSCESTAMPTPTPGKLCSVATTKFDDSGGPDRFLGPADHAAFGGCVENPPYYCLTAEGRASLLAAHEAVKTHLPRATSDPTKIRIGAKLVVIVLTNSYDALAKSALVSTDFVACTLDSAKQAAVDQAVAAEIAYLGGTSSAEAKVDQLHVIAPPCGSTCIHADPEQPHGTREVAAKLNGKVHDACSSVVTQIKAILDGIASPSVPKG